MKTSKKQPYANPEKTLIWFLRKSFVDANTFTLDGKTLSTAQKFKPVLDFWEKETNSTKKNNRFAPYEDIQKSLLEGWPLHIRYRRLLLEDFMMLNSNDNVVCFMRKAHSLFKSPTWTRNLKECLIQKPYEPLQLKGVIYFGFDMQVVRNISRYDILNGIYLKQDLRQNCTIAGGHGLTMELVGNHYQQLITFYNFINCGSSILFYSRSLPSRVSHIQKVINNITDTTRIGPTTSHFLDEVFGDRELSLSVLYTHDAKLKTRLCATEDKVMKEADISTNQIIQTFTLK